MVWNAHFTTRWQPHSLLHLEETKEVCILFAYANKETGIDQHVGKLTRVCD